MPKNTIIVYILFAVLIWNVLVFLLYGIDKHKAKKDKWRISEKTLLICAAVFGAAGALAGIKVFHHKTLHKKFSIGVPVMLVLQIAAAIYLLIKLV